MFVVMGWKFVQAYFEAEAEAEFVTHAEAVAYVEAWTKAGKDCSRFRIIAS